MGVIHWRLKNVLIIVLFFIGTFTIYKLYPHVALDDMLQLVYGDDESGPCNKNIAYVDPSKLGKKWPLIGIMGPPGSGVVWLRYLIEQLTGLHTGSFTKEYPELFVAEGKTRNVVVVMSHDIVPSRHMTAAIIIYRSLQESIRSQFAIHKSATAPLEAPMEVYYGKDWELFSEAEGKSWAKRYQDYIRLGIPLLVINHADLDDPSQLKKQLLHISHFLHVPIRHSVLDCLADRGTEYDLFKEYKPRTLRYGFYPIELLPQEKRLQLEKQENITERMVSKVKASFLPKVHV